MDKGAIIGTILGDSYVKMNKHTANLIMKHSIKQKYYALYKADSIGLNYSRAIHHSMCNGRTYPQISLYFEKSKELLDLYHLIYLNGEKTVTKHILKQLNRLGLAFWYFDDGSYHNGAIRLQTDCFPYNQQELIVEYFKSLDIIASIRKSKRNHCIYFNKENALRFLNYISPSCSDFPNSIKYKLGPLWDGNKEKFQSVSPK